MNEFFVGLVTAHPKTACLITFGVGLGLVPALKLIGYVF